MLATIDKKVVFSSNQLPKILLYKMVQEYNSNSVFPVSYVHG